MINDFQIINRLTYHFKRSLNFQKAAYLTPPFGFALFYLTGVAPSHGTTRQIYQGVLPFILIQPVGLGLLPLFPQVVTIVPDLPK